MVRAGVTVVALGSVPDAATPLRRLLNDTWPDRYDPGGPGRAGRDLENRCQINGMPFRVVALSTSGDVLGTAALSDASYGRKEDEGPWLVGLVVHSSSRRNGIGSALVAACETAATRFGFAEIYSATVGAGGLLRRRGWDVCRQIPDGTWIFRKPIK